MKKYNNNKKSNVPPFIQNLYNLIQKHSGSEIVRWGSKIGSFEILDVPLFCDDILPLYFNHHNLETFVRQLYNYEFKKLRIQNTDHCYFHNLFSKEKPQQMKKIKRKKYHKIQDSGEQDYQAFQSEIEEIQLFREKQNQFSLFLEFSLQKLEKMHKQNIQLMQTILEDKTQKKLFENVLRHFESIHQRQFSSMHNQKLSIYVTAKSELEKLMGQSHKYSYLTSTKHQDDMSKKRQVETLLESQSKDKKQQIVPKHPTKKNHRKIIDFLKTCESLDQVLKLLFCSVFCIIG